jgi:PAS domain S-box-containing protein
MNATEITRRREADELRETQARMLETLREAVAMVQPDGIIRLANASFDRLFGFATGGAIGTSLVHHVATDDSASDESFDRLMHEAAAQPVATRVERECTRCDGEPFIASIAAAAIHLADGAHWLVTFTDVTERKEMEREILEIANREQLRFGSDLHDGLGQDLTGIALMLRGVVAQLRKEDSRVQADIEEVIALVNGAIDSTRSMARGLSPVGADRGGLIAGLQSMATRGIDRYGVRTTLTTRLHEPLELNDARATHLYRIAQEALTNAVRHGRVSEVAIDLATGDGQLTLTILDNGRGLEPKLAARGGMGLKLMRYRAQMVAGELTIANRPEGGLMVRCVCPHRISGDSTMRRSGGLPLKD